MWIDLLAEHVANVDSSSQSTSRQPALIRMRISSAMETNIHTGVDFELHF